MNHNEEATHTAEPRPLPQLPRLPAAQDQIGRDDRGLAPKKGQKPAQSGRGVAARPFDLRQHKFLQALPQQLPALRSAMYQAMDVQRGKTSVLQVTKDLLHRSILRDNQLACVNYALATGWVLSQVESPSRTELAIHERLVERASELLEQMGIHPRTSNLSYMHADLYRSLAGRYLSCGMAEKAAWAVEFARFLDPHADRATADALLLGKAKTIAGAVVDAMPLFEAASASPLPPERADAALWQLRLAWWSGATSALSQYNAFILREFSGDEAVLNEHRWLIRLKGAFESGDLSLVLGPIDRGATAVPFSVRAACILFAHACQTKRWREDLAKIPASRLLGNVEPQDKPLRRFLSMMARLGDAKIPHNLKMALVKDIASSMDRLSDPLCRMLAAAALARWLRGVKQAPLATMFAHRYANQSAVLSQHRSQDLFDLVSDFAARPRQDASVSA